MVNVDYRTEFFAEGDKIVALAPELNVSSFGRNLDEAKIRIEEAVELFLEGCMEIGSLVDVLEESGFVLGDDGVWRRPTPLTIQDMRVAVSGT